MGNVLAAKICDFESLMLEGKLVFFGDDEKPLKPKVDKSKVQVGVLTRVMGCKNQGVRASKRTYDRVSLMDKDDFGAIKKTFDTGTP